MADVVSKKDAQLNIRLPADLLADLALIERRHKLSPQALLRGLADEAVAHFKETGSINFPLHIETGERPPSRKPRSA